MIEIVLGWPPSDLSPNKRLHWAKLAAAKKQYRKDCYSVSKEQLKKYRGVYENIPEKLVLEMTFIPPDRRSYDRDNLVARMKAGIDGLADALRINDKRFNTHTTGNSLWHERSKTYPSRHENTKIGMAIQKQTGRTLESSWRMTKANNLCC